jgi:hypothetical protein
MVCGDLNEGASPSAGLIHALTRQVTAARWPGRDQGGHRTLVARVDTAKWQAGEASVSEMIDAGQQSPGSFRSTLPDHDHRAMQD